MQRQNAVKGDGSLQCDAAGGRDLLQRAGANCCLLTGSDCKDCRDGQ